MSVNEQKLMKSLIVIRQQLIVPEIAFQPMPSFFEHMASSPAGNQSLLKNAKPVPCAVFKRK